MPAVWLSILLVLTTLGGVMMALYHWQRLASPHPELVRKLLHIPMGLMTLSFPWLFETVQSVLLVGGLAIATLLALRYYPPLASRFGQVLGGVKRRSLGEIYFPLSVMLLFGLTPHQPLLFCIPILILTLADAVAALIGTYYGHYRYTATEGQKSAEGSIGFFTVTFLSVHIPLLLFSSTGRAESLLIALILGLLVMLLEAIAWQGLDNLLIPLGSFLLLTTYVEMDVAALGIRLTVLLGLSLLVWGWHDRTTLNDSALLGAILVGYFCWAIGGWPWLVAPLTLLISYPFLIYRVFPLQAPLSPAERQWMAWLPDDAALSVTPRHPPHWQRVYWQRIHNVHAVLSVAAAGLCWLFIYRLTNASALLYPYTLAFAANLAIIGIAGLPRDRYWARERMQWVSVYTLLSWLLLYVPLVVMHQFARTAVLGALLGLVGIGSVAIAYYCTQPKLRQSNSRFQWLCRVVYTLLGSLAALLPLN